MSLKPRRRQIVLFLVAVILPSTVLVALGVQLVRQEQALADQQLVDERRLIVAEARQTLFTMLEQVQREVFDGVSRDTLGFASKRYPASAVVLAARVDGGVLRLPWTPDPRAELGRTSLMAAPFARRVADGKRAEFGNGDATGAVRRYEEALAQAEDSIQVAYARLLLGRALAKSGRGAEALAHNRQLLDLPSSVTDEVGVPIALYAAARLLQDGRRDRAWIERVSASVHEPRWRSPAESYLLRDLLEQASHGADSAVLPDASDLMGIMNTEIAVIERAIDLQANLPGLGLRSSGVLETDYGPRWIRFGDEWLVGAAPIESEGWGIVVLALNQVPVLVAGAATWPAAAQVVITDGTETVEDGEPFDPAIAAVYLTFGADVLPGRGAALLRRGFYVGALLLVLSVTLFGAYVFWFDVRRELRMGELRALFVSSVSHELKTPLTAIRMFAERLRMKERPDTKMQNQYLDTIVGESERLTRLLNNVLDLSKIEQAQKRYRRDPVDLAEVVDCTVRALGYPLVRGGFTLNVDVDDHPPRVQGDADALEQALLNLLSNAMKYSGENKEIDLRLFARNGDAIIEVTDRGVGIPTDAQARLTEKFYRVPTDENERIPGTGLGLALVHHAMEAHGGQLTVQSAEGKGSTFTIHLPVDDG